MNSPTEAQLVEELKALNDNQSRIDRIGEDIDSGDFRYKDLGAYELAELLGVDMENPDTGFRSGLIYKRDVQDEGFDHPYAENIHHLENSIPQKRFLSLSEEATRIIESGVENTDIKITKKEKDIISTKFSEDASCGYFDLVYACTELETTDDNFLEFSWFIGDAGDIEDPITPCENHMGKSFDFENYIESEAF